MTKALLIVDVQNDFCEGGALGVAGGHAVADRINGYLRDNLHLYDIIVASQDWHEIDSTNGGHIALPPDEPDFVDSWPVHCIQETEGSDLHEQIWDVLDWVQTSALPVEIVRKGDGRPAYSAFEGWSTTPTATGYRQTPLEAILEDAGVTDIDVVGIATDHCVKESVMDALENDFSVTVLTEMIAGVDPVRSATAVSQMSDRGAEIV
jgi:nicotinamidase/pyrazinamidase